MKITNSNININSTVICDFEFIRFKCGKYFYDVNLKPIIWILRLFRIAKRVEE